MKAVRGIDVIGDLHGYHRELEALLAKMGYRRVRGVWRHPRRFAVFVGDTIDRGPAIEAVLETVAAMREAGAAECLLGNHERDALFYHTLHRGRPLRVRQPSRTEQLEATHDQLGEDSPTLHRWLGWMRTLPLLFETPGLRVVHSAWHGPSADFWRGRTLGDDGMTAALAASDSAASVALFNLVFGPVAAAPKSRGGFAVRLLWYRRFSQLRRRTLWHASFHRQERTRGLGLPAAAQILLWGYGRDEPPLVFGHQALTRRRFRRPLAPNLACVDYGVAYGGPLCAYRWSGETRLTERHFVAVAPRPGQTFESP